MLNDLFSASCMEGLLHLYISGLSDKSKYLNDESETLFVIYRIKKYLIADRFILFVLQLCATSEKKNKDLM